MSKVVRVRASVLVSGMVQGVGFRASTQKRAEQLDLIGWVRNLDDGRVAVLAEGERTSIEPFVEWLRLGPPFAQVTDVAVHYSEPTGEFKAFSIRSTSEASDREGNHFFKP